VDEQQRPPFEHAAHPAAVGTELLYYGLIPVIPFAHASLPSSSRRKGGFTFSPMMARSRRNRVHYPDLWFHHPSSGSVTYVGDIKYKLTADAQARSTDYYRLLAYATALDLPEGVLIYCQTDGANLPVRSRYATPERDCTSGRSI
jgi:hypothetical protein